jgi:APA family basic amino acid/polyamine antiporter
MSRDGLLPPVFSAIHPKYKTPWFSTIVTGLFVAVPSLFMNLTEVTDLTSIGTLFAFLLVCGGSLRFKPQEGAGRFRVPYFNSKWVFPALSLIAAALIWTFNAESVQGFFAWEGFSHKIPVLVYLIGMAALNVLCFTKSLSLIPVLGLASCGYLISELGIANWTRFGMWLALGLVVYFLYGARHSRLRGMNA